MDVDAYALARRLDIPAPSERILRKLDDLIEDAVADVEGYLGRPITPVQISESGLWPTLSGWDLKERPRRIVATTPEMVEGQPSGRFTVIYETGLDWRTDQDLSAIRRYVMAAAENHPTAIRLWQAETGARGPIKSVSTEGQSVTYGDVSRGGGGAAGSGNPGSLPTLASLERWRMRTVHQGPTRGNQHWLVP